VKNKIWVFALLSLAMVGGRAVAQTCSWTTLTNGSTADANAVMGNFNCAALLTGAHFTGSVGIGTASPVSPLEVDGVVTVDAQVELISTNPGIVVKNTGGGTDAKYWFPVTINSNQLVSYITNDANTSATIYQTVTRSGFTVSSVAFPNGQVDIGNLSGTGNRAVYSDASGNLTNTSSDARMKDKIAPLVDGLKDVEALKPVSFNWRSELQSKYGPQREIGFLAQDVRKVVPEVVGTNHDGTLSVDYPKLVAVLTKAVQEQQAEIADLRSAVAELKRKVGAGTEH
jgi:Chaperone of endosialidase